MYPTHFYISYSFLYILLISIYLTHFSISVYHIIVSYTTLAGDLTGNLTQGTLQATSRRTLQGTLRRTSQGTSQATSRRTSQGIFYFGFTAQGILRQTFNGTLRQTFNGTLQGACE